MTASTALLEAKGLFRRHPDGTRWLLEDASFGLAGKERAALVGASGSGKTLLLRALALLDPVDGGEVCWQGRPVRRDAIPAFRARAIYLHQRPSFDASTVDESLRRPFLLATHRRQAFDRSRAIGLLDQLGRDAAFLDKNVRDLSGGEIQIAALVRAILLDPAVLLLDEPTAALDAKTSAAVERLISDWVDRSPDGRAVVWVTHDAEQAARVGKRIVSMKAGKVESGEW